MPENRWPKFCKALDLPEIEHDPRFAGYIIRLANIDELYEILDERFLTKTSAEWMELLKEADCICAPVATYEDLVNDPQVRANDYIVEVDHPTQGRLAVVGAPWRFSETPAKVAPAAPELGQHTEEILQEMDYSWEQIEELRSQGVMG